MLNWLKIKVIFPITAGLNDLEEVSEVQRMQMGIKDGDQYETEWGYYNIGQDMPIQLNPCCFIPRDKVNKKYYTQVIFSSELIILAEGKPESVYKVIEDYINSLPEEKETIEKEST